MSNKLYRSVAWLQMTQSPFAIARLIMMSGVNLRKVGPDDPEDRRAIIRVEQAARAILSTADLDVFSSMLMNDSVPTNVRGR